MRARGGRRGRAPTHRSLVTGIDGTPMPSFAETLTSEQVLDVVHYVLDLGRRARHAESWLATELNLEP